MGSAPHHVFGWSQCPHCGADVAVARLLHGGHRCDPAAVEAYEAQQLLTEAERIHVEVADYLDSEPGRNRLAFAGWCREHGR